MHRSTFRRLVGDRNVNDPPAGRPGFLRHEPNPGCAGTRHVFVPCRDDNQEMTGLDDTRMTITMVLDPPSTHAEDMISRDLVGALPNIAVKYPWEERTVGRDLVQRSLDAGPEL